jgi:riboflavin kinase/FMN adenylyltransferase
MPMHSFRGDDHIPGALQGAVVAIGNFDGVHRGHQSLLAVARNEAAAAKNPFGVLTFEPHPRLFFRPDQPMFRLTPHRLKQRLLAAAGADFQLTLSFDRALANLEAQDFVRNILVDRLRVGRVVTGYDFHFGRGRKGNPDLMRRLGREFGFAVSVIDQVTDDHGQAPFSSSAIRDDLRHGRVAEAAQSLGYWWMINGDIVRGDGRGRMLGYPTANIVLDPGVEPREGIYAVRLTLSGRRLAGAAYIGTRPTFSTGTRFLEVFIFDFDGEIYGEAMDVHFLAFLRGDEKFPTPEALMAQMRLDCDKAASLLRAIEADDPMRNFPFGRLQAEGRL